MKRNFVAMRAPRSSSRRRSYLVAIVLCLTLGLAPFVPEPHLIGKWRWLLGGAEGMKAMDWFDLAMHSAPFAYLIALVFRDVATRRKKPSATSESGS